MNYVHLKSCGSTQDVARRLSGWEREVIVQADRQSAGRGRRSSNWISPEGGLYSSLATSVPGSIQPSLLPLAAAQAWKQLIRHEWSLKNLQVKWPNDLMVQGSKLGGFLGVSRNGWTVLGMGLNVEGSPDSLPEADYSPTCLDDWMVDPPDRTALLASWWRKFSRWLSQPSRYLDPRHLGNDLQPIGQTLRLHGESVRAVSLDPSGALVIERAGESRRIRPEDPEVDEVDLLSG